MERMLTLTQGNLPNLYATGLRALLLISLLINKSSSSSSSSRKLDKVPLQGSVVPYIITLIKNKLKSRSIAVKRVLSFLQKLAREDGCLISLGSVFHAQDLATEKALSTTHNHV